MADEDKVKSRNIIVPPMPARRPGIYYGYYGVLSDDQIERTRNHTNLLWAIPWHHSKQHLDRCKADILAAKQPTFLDLNAPFFATDFEIEKDTIKDVVIDDSCEQRIETWLRDLEAAGALKYVVGIVMMDEFNLRGFTRSMVIDCLNRIKRVIDKFPILSDVKYVVTYGAGAEFVGFDLFDYIGFDAYHYNSAILRTDGPYVKRVRRNLTSKQRTLIYPGGYSAYKQDPIPFVNFAFRNHEVIGIIPFCWGGSTEVHGFTGIKDDENMVNAYTAAGRIVIGK